MVLTIRNSTHPICIFLSRPDDPSSCARCILGALALGIGSGYRKYGERTYWRQWVQDVDFWNSLVRFLFAVRTEEQIRQLLDRLNYCACPSPMGDLATGEYHRVGQSIEEDYIASRACIGGQTTSIAFIRHLFLTLSSALDSVHLKAVAKRTTNHWPTCPDDLMPFGPKNLVESFVAWSHFVYDTVIFRVAAQCIKLCGSLLIPFAIQSALTRRVVDVGRHLFDRTWASLSSSTRTTSSQTTVLETFPNQIRPLIVYFSLYNEQPIEKKVIMLDGYELKAVEIFSLLIYLANEPRLILASPEILELRDALAEEGFYISYCLSQYIDPPPTILVYPDICNKNISPPEGSAQWESSEMPKYDPTYVGFDLEVALESQYKFMAREVLKSIRQVRLGLSCSARDCSNSIHTTGKALRRCKACKLVSYCSKECQVAAWNCKPFAHKSICKILQKLVATADSDLIFNHCRPDVSSSQGKSLFIASLSPSEDLVALITKKWQDGHVLREDLLKVLGWTSCKLISPLPTKAECAPGYTDYEGKIKELGGRNGALKAQPLVLEKISLEEFDEYRSSFDEASEGMI